MKDSFADPESVPASSGAARRDALHALGSLYVRQGFPKQGLSLLLAARRFAEPDLALNSATAHAYLLAGSPKKAIALLEAMEPALTDRRQRLASARLQARALLALGRVAEARALHARTLRGGKTGGANPIPLESARRTR